MNNLIKATPWDTVTFGMSTWELAEYSENTVGQASKTQGHHTIKVDPLTSKYLLHRYGFYYCDTLLEPYGKASDLRFVQLDGALVSKQIDTKQALSICHGAFSHGRFHRDFNLSKEKADLRYDNWLKQLLDVKQVYGLYWQDELAGFIAYNANNLVLHAVAEKYRGKGLAKYWWSAVCHELFTEHEEITSSISASNIAILRLYTSLGFSFRHPQDVYHSLVV